MLGHEVGKHLKDCSFVAVAFAGGMSELAHIPARSILVNDLHRHVLNLAQVVRDQHAELVALLEAEPFHPDVLASAQERCRHREGVTGIAMPLNGDLHWARDYFICSWMARNGKAGTKSEFDTGMSLRYEAGGGDSAKRFRSATEALKDWSKIMSRCTFTTDDVFAMLDKIADKEGVGVYADPPFPKHGDSYKFGFTEAQHQQLALRLAQYEKATVVCRFFDVPLIRKLYSEQRWTWHLLEGRNAANNATPEVLLVNRRTA